MLIKQKKQNYIN